MKLAMIGSYGHAGIVLDGAAGREDVHLVAAARWGTDDPLGYVGTHPSAPADLPIYDEYRAMLDAVRPDVVGVFLPLYRNAQASLAAIERGCHVVSEKPLATTRDDLARLRQAIVTADVQVAALLATRAQPAFQAIRRAVHEGQIGDPVLATGQKSYPFAQRDAFCARRETYGGSIPWQAIHALDFVSYCCGRDYARVAGMHGNAAHPTHPGMEDHGGLLLEFVGGGTALIGFDYLRPWPGDGNRAWGDDRLRIAGTEGVLETRREGRGAALMTDRAEGELDLPEPLDFFGAFVDRLTGTGNALISTAESLRITDVALRARDAADSGRVVDLTA